MPKGVAILQHQGIRFSEVSEPGVLQLAPLSDAALAELVACLAEGGAGEVGRFCQPPVGYRNKRYSLLWPYALRQAGMNANKSNDVLVGHYGLFLLSCIF